MAAASKMLYGLALLGLAVSCGGGGKATNGANVAPAVESPAPRVPVRVAAGLPPCPEGDALQKVARAAWQVVGGTLTVSCAPGRFGTPAWAVWGLAYDVPNQDSEDSEGDDESELEGQRHLALVQPSGEVMAHAAQYGLRWLDLDYGPTPSYRPQDLDGDGVDELVTLVQDTRGGLFLTTLAVTRLVGAELLKSDDSLFVSFDDSAAVDEAPGPTSCAGRVSGKGRQVVVRHDQPVGDAGVWKGLCPTAGVKHFVMKDGHLVPVAR